MPVKSFSSFQTRIYQLLFGLVFIALGFMAVRRMMSGSLQGGQLIAATVSAVAVTIILDRRYWLLLPIMSGFGLKVPGLPFSGAELGQIAIVAIHFFRLGLHRDNVATINSLTWPVLPVSFWIAGIYCLNPCGLAIFGTSTIGSRFYMQMLLGFCVFWSLASLKLDEQDCKLLFRVMIFSALFQLFRQTLIPQTDPEDVQFDGVELEKSARYAFIGFGTLYLYIFARHPLPDILRSVPLLTTVCVFAGLTIMSGKRQAFGRLLVIPWFSVFLRGRGRAAALLASCVGAIIILFLVAGDGSFYSLPKSASRSLSVISPKLNSKGAMDGGTKDIFRREMRKQARMVISEHPFVGRKGFAMNLNDTIWMHSGSHGDRFAIHAYSGNWHSTWYAFAADFGLPCLFLFAFLYLRVVAFDCRQCRLLVPGSYSHLVMMIFALEILCALVFSYTSGHSPHVYPALCRDYGMAIAVASGATKLQTHVSGEKRYVA